MKTIKTGRDFTGYLMFRNKKTNIAVRVFVGPFFFNGYAADGKTPANMKQRIQCPTGGHWSICQGTPIYGRFVEETICNGKCMGAIGDSCDCSCGGMNHGGSHSGAS